MKLCGLNWLRRFPPVAGLPLVMSMTSCSAQGIHKQLTGAANPSIQQVYTGYLQQTGVEPRHSESIGWASRPVLSAGQASYVPSAGNLTLIAYGLILTTCPILLNKKTDASKLVPFVIRLIWVNLCVCFDFLFHWPLSLCCLQFGGSPFLPV